MNAWLKRCVFNLDLKTISALSWEMIHDGHPPSLPGGCTQGDG